MRIRTLVLALLAVLAWPTRGSAHCDTLDGPVVEDARRALDTGTIDPVLKWVRADAEPELRATFDKVVAARATSEPAREVADTWFLETTVRLHRAGEGVGFEGLKPAGTLDPLYQEADEALASGSVDGVGQHLTDAVDEELRVRYAKAHALRAVRDRDLGSGRAYVAAYTEYMHYVEAIHGATRAEDHEHADDVHRPDEASGVLRGTR